MRLPEKTAPAPPRYCECGAKIARDNTESTCSPCTVSANARELERLASSEDIRRLRRRQLSGDRANLTMSMVPLCGTYDRLGPDLVRECVYWWAKTGDAELVAYELDMKRIEVTRCLSRVPAQEIIDLMLEEGTWPDGAPLGKRRERWK